MALKRFRTRLRQGQRQVEDLSLQTEATMERHFFGRLERLLPVRRFVISWLLLVVLLIAAVLAQTVMLDGYFQSYQPVPGGIYTEGVLGRFTTASPLFATSDADTSVSRLMFSGLLAYNNHNQLVPGLASSYSVDAKDTKYTVHLRPHLSWQDGQPVTSKDVMFTFQAIQNPDTQSPLLSSWQGITIAAPTSDTITFTLPTPLASFPYNLTTGIVPQHILASIPATELRSADFNTVHPIGTGAFMWQSLQVTGSDPVSQQEQINLLPFTHYYAGTPKLSAFNVRVYADQDQLATALKSKQLTAAEGFDNLPATLQHNSSIVQQNLILTASTMVFFKTSSGVLSDTTVRQALTQATNVPAILSSIGYSTRAVHEPLLKGQLAYDPSLQQTGYNAVKAAAALDADGWKLGSNGVRVKGTQKLTFGLTASNTPEYHAVVDRLTQQWHAVGASVIVHYLDPSNLQDTLTEHDYDALLYGISIGVDPDVFVYWDSSQADIRSANRLNLSEYKNATADAALEAGRTRLDPALRVIKYKPFLQAWQQDAPAVGLYQPRILYLTNGNVKGLQLDEINTAADRFNNVQNWEIKQVRVTNTAS